MNEQICPHCKNRNTCSVAFCLFCGKPLRLRSGRIPCDSGVSPRVTATTAGKAQATLFVFALLVAAVTAILALITPPAPLQIKSLSEIAAPAPAEKPEGTLFSRGSGAYAITMFVSEVESDDPIARSAADAMTGKRFDGVINIAIDSIGAGSIEIEQAFFLPESIVVSAFADERGNVSDNTLYGIALQSGMKISIVCVFEGNAVSGFIWMDNANTHIEFLYFS